MNIEEYISSGILECYVLNQLNRTETEKVEALAAQYPEIMNEIRAIEEGLENYASLHGIQPQAALKNKILDSILPANGTASEEVKTIEVYKFSKTTAYLAAASIALALLAGSASLYYSMQWEKAKQEVISLREEKARVADTFTKASLELKTELQAMDHYLALVRDTSTKTVRLKGLAISPASKAVVWWNKDSKEVYLDVKNLPKPSSDKQYQLWALMDGLPINAGVFEVSDTLTLQKMKNIMDAQAFAVTLEKRGGSVVPSLESLYIMGNI